MNDWYLAVLAIPLGFVLLALLFTVPPTISLTALIAARTLTDIGASSTGSLLPSATLSGLISAAIITFAFFTAIRNVRFLSAASACLLAGSIFVLLTWTLIGIYNFGLQSALVLVSLQYASYLAIFTASALVFRGRINDLTIPIAIVTFIPALLLIVTFTAGWTPTINGTGRAVGSFSHANSAAAFFAAATLAALGLYFYNRAKILLLAALAGISALLLTQSLGALIGLAIGLIVLIVSNSQLSITRRVLILVFFATLATFFFFSSAASQRLSELENLNPDRALSTGVSGNSVEWRFINWQLLLELWGSDAPILGFGIGATRSFVAPLGAPPHSLFIEWLVEFGILGATVIALSAFIFIRTVRRIRSRNLRAAAWSLAALFVANGTASNLLGYSAAMFLFMFAAGALLARAEVAGDEFESSSTHLSLGSR